VLAATQRPYAAAAFAAAPSGPPAWKTLPCWYLLGTQDKAIPPALQRFMAERANATIVEVPASHVSFVSQPEAATQLILQAVGHCCIRGDRVWQRDCWYENPPPSPCSRYAV
jgi:pimeloyl-ACP methyl ester carboxylesterase